MQKGGILSDNIAQPGEKIKLQDGNLYLLWEWDLPDLDLKSGYMPAVKYEKTEECGLGAGM